MFNNYVHQYNITSDVKCGLYPYKEINMEFSRRADILRQAANRIVIGETTFAEEVYTLVYYMGLYKRLEKPSSKKHLIYDLRRLIRKADPDNRYTNLYRRIYVQDDSISRIIKSAEDRVHDEITKNRINDHDFKCNQKQQQLDEYQATLKEIKIQNDRLAREYAYYQFREQNTIVAKLPDLYLPPVSPVMPPVSPVMQIESHLEESHSDEDSIRNSWDAEKAIINGDWVSTLFT